MSSCQKTERHANNQKRIGAPRQDLRLSAPAVFGNFIILAEECCFVKHYFEKISGIFDKIPEIYHGRANGI